MGGKGWEIWRPAAQKCLLNNTVMSCWPHAENRRRMLRNSFVCQG